MPDQNILYLDTASTTGRWEWKLGETAPAQPHLVRIAAQLWLNGKDNMIDGQCDLIRPLPGWPPITGHDIHGVYDHDLHQHGIVLGVAMRRFHKLMEAADLIVMQNAQFHMRLIRRAYRDADFGEPPADKRQYCTMMEGKGSIGGGKFPKLTDSYRFFAREALVLPSDPIERGETMIGALRRVHLGLTGVMP